AARHASHAGEQAERDLGGDAFQIIAAGADDFQRPARIARPALGDRHDQFAGKIFPGPGLRRSNQIIDLALRDDVAAMDAGAGVRYSRPTSTRNLSRSRISLSTRTAISFCLAVSR